MNQQLHCNIAKNIRYKELSNFKRILLTVSSLIITGLHSSILKQEATFGVYLALVLELVCNYFVFIPTIELMFSEESSRKEMQKSQLKSMGLCILLFVIWSVGITMELAWIKQATIYLFKIIGNLIYFIYFIVLCNEYKNGIGINLYRISSEGRYVFFVASNIFGAIVLSAVFGYGPWIAVFAVILIYRRTKKEKKLLKDAKYVVFGLQDFCVKRYCEEKSLREDYKKNCVRQEWVSYSLYKKHKVSFPELAVFYYNPKFISYIPENKRQDCFENVVQYFCQLKEQQQQVVVVCPDLGKEQNGKMDPLKMRFISEGFVIYYGMIDKTIEKNTLKEMQSVVFENHSVQVPISVKNIYIINQLEVISSIQDATQKFYSIVKLVEYIFQYRGLYAMSLSECYKEGLEVSFSMGYWNTMQLQLEKKKHVYSYQELLDAMSTAYTALGKKIPNNSKYSYTNICETLVMLRNKFIGHGTIAYSVSTEMVKAVEELAWCIIENYLVEEKTIVPNVTKLCSEYAGRNDISCMIVEKGYPLLLTYFMIEENNLVTDYMDFESGRITSYGKMHRQKLAMNKEITDDEWGE